MRASETLQRAIDAARDTMAVRELDRLARLLRRCGFPLEQPEYDGDGAPTWRTADGRMIPVSDMEDSHLLNALRFMVRRKRENMVVIEGGLDWRDLVEADPRVQVLATEAIKRGFAGQTYGILGRDLLDVPNRGEGAVENPWETAALISARRRDDG